MRVARVAVIWLGLVLLAACGPAGAPSPSSSTTPGQTATPAPDLTAPGVAQSVVADLMAYAGSTRVINVEITRTQVQVCVVRGQSATTYAWSAGTMTAVDADTAYVGQAMFDPRAFDLADISGLFATAAKATGSDKGQKLQVVDYDDGRVYMNVTTNPETFPVFFTTNAHLVPRIDPTDPILLAGALADVTDGATAVVQVGITADGSVFADWPAGANQIAHTVRNQQFPPFVSLKTAANPSSPFAPGLVSAAGILHAAGIAADAAGKPRTSAYSVAVYRAANDPAPTIFVTIGGRTIQTTLDGTVLTG